MDEDVPPEIRSLGYSRCAYIDLTEEGQNHTNANDIIASYFQERANELLTEMLPGLTKYSGTVAVSFLFVRPTAKVNESLASDLGIFVAPIKCDSGFEFVICVSALVVDHLTSIFTAIEVGPDNVIAGVSEEDISRHFEAVFLKTCLALLYIFFHEFAHVANCHIPYLKKISRRRFLGFSRPPDSSLFALGQLKAPPAVNTPKLVKVHRAMEIDADLLAITLMTQFIRDGLLREFLSLSADTAEFPRTFGNVIYTLMQILELWRRNLSGEPYNRTTSSHPHPDVRAIFTEGLFLNRQATDHEQQVGKDAFDSAFVLGMQEAAEKMHSFGGHFLPEFAYIQEIGIESALEEYDVLREDLQELSLCLKGLVA